VEADEVAVGDDSPIRYRMRVATPRAREAPARILQFWSVPVFSWFMREVVVRASNDKSTVVMERKGTTERFLAFPLNVQRHGFNFTGREPAVGVIN